MGKRENQNRRDSGDNQGLILAWSQSRAGYSHSSDWPDANDVKQALQASAKKIARRAKPEGLGEVLLTQHRYGQVLLTIGRKP